MKKWVAGIVIVLVIIFGSLYLYSSNNTKDNSTDNNESTSKSKDTKASSNGKVLVVYYSAQNHTKKVAEEIAKRLNADTFVIEPKDKYTSSDLDWTNSNSRVSKEHENSDLRNVELKENTPSNFGDYNTVILGYPIWWGDAAWPVNTFVKNNDFTSKTVIPFCTSYSSGIGDSARELEEDANGGNWLDGKRFSSSESLDDVDSWVDSLDL